MKELFYYNKPGQEYEPSQVLLLCIGEKQIGCCITDTENNELYRLAFCQAEEPEEISITEFGFKYAFVNQVYATVKIAFDYRQSVVLPRSLSIKDPQLFLDTHYGGSFHLAVQTDDISRWNVKNLYAVPREVNEWLKEKFPAAKYCHHLSAGIHSVEQGPGAGLLRLDFRSEDFTIIVAQGKELFLAQAFAYSTPGDILYYLLHCCRQFFLSPDDVRVALSGLLDIDSALYKELYQYFINIEFRDAGWGAAADYPAHFFTSFNELAVCAS